VIYVAGCGNPKGTDIYVKVSRSLRV